MNNMPHISISVASTDGDPIVMKQCMDRLKQNLTFAGIGFCPHLEEDTSPLRDIEIKSIPVSLYTLGLTFITSGAAVALINAVQATFAAMHNSQIRIRVLLPGKSIELAGDHLNDSRSEQLLATLKEELQS